MKLDRLPAQKYLLPWIYDSEGKVYNSLGILISLYASEELAERVTNAMNLTAQLTDEQLKTAEEIEIVL